MSYKTLIWCFSGGWTVMFTFLSGSDHVSLPVLQLQPGVFHTLIFWDVADVQNPTVEALLIHVPFGCSETTT